MFLDFTMRGGGQPRPCLLHLPPCRPDAQALVLAHAPVSIDVWAFFVDGASSPCSCPLPRHAPALCLGVLPRFPSACRTAPPVMPRQKMTSFACGARASAKEKTRGGRRRRRSRRGRERHTPAAGHSTAGGRGGWGGAVGDVGCSECASRFCGGVPAGGVSIERAPRRARGRSSVGPR